ncbi:MAG TPA: IPT/TIG domain-containing protein [Thermoanaerobaculia bacterium]|nr:IPT/TIG domain-containing protein [Thermoanaerobaculia bacterium]
MSSTEPPGGPENGEWRLADLLDAIASEVDRAQDAVALKSLARGLTFGLKGLDLDLAVTARFDPAGRLLFRTADPGQSGGSVLKLSLEEVAQGQVEEVRTPLDGAGLPLSTLPGITAEEIAALGRLSIFTLDDLRPYTASAALAAALARQSGVAEPHLRRWLGLPYLTAIDPPAGSPGQTATLSGGHLGAADPQNQVYFQTRAAAILSWSDTAVSVRIPAGAETGTVFAVPNGSPDVPTNALPWTLASPPAPPPLALQSLSPPSGQAGATLTLALVGTGFAAGMTVSLGAGITVSGLTVEAPERATVTLALAASATPGPRDVTVTLPPASATLPGAFTVTAVPPPPTSTVKVTGVDPDHAQAATTQLVTINGSGFLPGASAAFGDGVQVLVQKVTPTQIVAVLTIAPQALGPRAVRVANSDGGKGALKAGFQVLAPPSAPSAPSADAKEGAK